MLCVSVPEGGPRTPMGEGRAAYRRGGEGEYKTNWWVSARKTCNSSALAMELHLSCINPWKWYWMKGQVDTQKWDNMRLSEFVMILILWPSEIWLGLRQYPHVQGVINTTDQSVSILHGSHAVLISGKSAYFETWASRPWKSPYFWIFSIEVREKSWFSIAVKTWMINIVLHKLRFFQVLLAMM